MQNIFYNFFSQYTLVVYLRIMTCQISNLDCINANAFKLWPLTLVAPRLGSSISGEERKTITWKKILLRSDCRCGLTETGSNQLHMTL